MHCPLLITFLHRPRTSNSHNELQSIPIAAGFSHLCQYEQYKLLFYSYVCTRTSMFSYDLSNFIDFVITSRTCFIASFFFLSFLFFTIVYIVMNSLMIMHCSCRIITRSIIRGNPFKSKLEET